MTSTKQILVLGRRDHAEAMRVSAGLTIFGHTVRLVFMNGPVEETEENAQQAELLELADISPETTLPDLEIDYVSAGELAAAMIEARAVINV